MLHVKKLPEFVLSDLQEYFEENKNCPFIYQMSVREAFNAYLEWNGIVGYTQDIMDALDGIRKADIGDKDIHK